MSAWSTSTASRPESALPSQASQMTPRATASQNPRPEAISHNHVDSAIPVAARGMDAG